MLALVAAATIALPDFGRAQSSSKTAVSPSTASAPAPAAAASPQAKKTIRQKIRAFVEKIPERLKMDKEFLVASAQFPSFCEHWQQNLRDRETANRNGAKYVEKEATETATYTGYGKIAVCEAHQSKTGYSIGRITYEEFTYFLTGKSLDDAKISEPKPVNDLHTTELFRWENGKWFY